LHNDLDLLYQFQHLLKSFECIQKTMDNYLEMKRQLFPRFYFVSNDELVQILSLSRQPELIQIHLKKFFENIKCLRLVTKRTQLVHGIVSHEDEELKFLAHLPLEGNVEHWLKELENKMQTSVREYLKNSLTTLKLQTNKRDKWIKDWPSQACVTASEIQWTLLTGKALGACQIERNSKPLKKLFHSHVRYSSILFNMNNE
jgi:dynein heavy chain, axonemal